MVNCVRACYLALVCGTFLDCAGQSWGRFWEVAPGIGKRASYANPIIDTGETLCASGGAGTGAMATCPQSVSGQDGDSVNVPNARAFIGPTGHSTYLTDYTTTDTVKGLVWKTCVDGLSGVGCATGSFSTLTWSGAGTACSALNTANSGAGFAGIKNWRLPSIEELQSLINIVSSPTIDAINFPGTILDVHWSATISYANGSNSWSIDFADDSEIENAQSNLGIARCVSGSSQTRGPYTTVQTGIILDGSNGLVWQKCSAGLNNDATCTGSALTQTWVNAIAYCQTLGLAGKSWRLPNLNELFSLAKFSAANPAIDVSAFPATPNLAYWSSTTMSGNTLNAHTVNFSAGGSGFAAKSGSLNVRCVTDN